MSQTRRCARTDLPLDEVARRLVPPDVSTAEVTRSWRTRASYQSPCRDANFETLFAARGASGDAIRSRGATRRCEVSEHPPAQEDAEKGEVA
jgi:hypothetical protein